MSDIVVCTTCFGGFRGCPGGDYCPYLNVPLSNAQVVVGGEGTVIPAEGAEPVVSSTIAVSTVVPRMLSRHLTRSLLEMVLAVVMTSKQGPVVSLSGMEAEQIAKSVNDGRVPVGEALGEILKRCTTANATNLARLTSLASILSSMTKVGVGSAPLAAPGGGADETLGVYSLLWAVSGKIVNHRVGSVAIGGGSTAINDGVAEHRALLRAKLIRPKSPSQFSFMMTTWSMLCHSMGVANHLATGNFLLHVVHEPVEAGILTWQVAHELLVVYLDAIEVQVATGGSRLTLANAWYSGGQDLYLERAVRLAVENFNVSPKKAPREGGSDIFRSPDTVKGNPGGKPCFAFNFAQEHRSEHLDEQGCCKFAHVCDKRLKSGGTCGSSKHGRSACDNPARVQ